MSIQLLDENTINKIAAGEVVERPASVVKELVENAIDANASSITIEIKEGGISFIRITDNGSGIEKNEADIAFLRHSTSKIRTATDLLTISSLGFRGEALASIASVSQIELITKTADSLTGIRYIIEGGEKIDCKDIGAPDGTTFIVKNLFYNTPARRKFLKSANTEGAYISDLVEHMAMSHPEISFKFINNNSIKLHTYGNNNLKEIIYSIYGRDIASNLIPIDSRNDFMNITGFIGKPMISRGNRNYMTYYINNRYIKSNILNRAIEDSYSSFLMQHRYPFTALHIEISPEIIDVNVHPTKMELRFSNGNEVRDFLYDTLFHALSTYNLVTDVEIDKKPAVKANAPVKTVAEPFEQKRIAIQEKVYEKMYSYPKNEQPVFVKETAANYSKQVLTDNKKVENDKTIKSTDIYNITVNETKSPREDKIDSISQDDNQIQSTFEQKVIVNDKSTVINNSVNDNITSHYKESIKEDKPVYVQETLFESKDAYIQHRIIGQLFDTYWLIEYDEKLYIIDQHAAHEKILYERLCQRFAANEVTTQNLMPPVIFTLSMREEEILKKHNDVFLKLGLEIEHFGDREYALRAVPQDLYGLNSTELMTEILDNLVNDNSKNITQSIHERIATMACKAAVKGNNRLSYNEADALISELLKLNNPFNCPHGRPTIIAISKYELEKKFKRII